MCFYLQQHLLNTDKEAALPFLLYLFGHSPGSWWITPADSRLVIRWSLSALGIDLGCYWGWSGCEHSVLLGLQGSE